MSLPGRYSRAFVVSVVKFRRKELTMYGIRRILVIGVALACLVLSAGVALSGLSNPAGAAAAIPAIPKQAETDPRLHHLSGVVAIPPWQVEGEAAVRALGGDLGH